MRATGTMGSVASVSGRGAEASVREQAAWMNANESAAVSAMDLLAWGNLNGRLLSRI